MDFHTVYGPPVLDEKLSKTHNNPFFGSGPNIFSYGKKTGRFLIPIFVVAPHHTDGPCYVLF